MNLSINLKELRNSFDSYKKNIEEVNYDEITFLYIGDYYDGMLEGMLEYQSNKYRFEIITDYKKISNPRIFAIIILTEEEIKDEEYWNGQFDKYVGNHNNLTTTEDNILKPSSEHHLFYDEYNKRQKNKYEYNIVKGWYIE